MVIRHEMGSLCDVESRSLMRRRSRLRAECSLLIGILLIGIAVLACTSLPRHPRPGDFEGVGQAFSGRMAAAQLEALGGLGDRSPGTESDELARAYLAREFRRSGAKSSQLGHGDREHLIADLAGESPDIVLVVAAYPVLGSVNGVDETGAAILVELSRVLGSREQPYALRFALAETRPSSAESTIPSTTPSTPESSDRQPASKVWEPCEAAKIARELSLIEAGRELARGLEAEGPTDRIRAIIVLDLSLHSNPVFARDLRSHPGFREIFWASAARLGFESMFPPDAEWASPASLQLGFREHSMDRILTLVDVASLPRERGAGTPGSDGESTARALGSLGRVMVDALGSLMERLEKVDAFSR
jgi:hypothetical protein